MLGSWGCGGSAAPDLEPFQIVACSLGCTAPGLDAALTCDRRSVAENELIRIVFSQPVDLASVDQRTFQVIEDNNRSPVPRFGLDPSNPRVLIYQPQVTFVSQGPPIRGFSPGASISLRVPGRAHGDPGPYIRSRSGAELLGRLVCTLVASEGVIDFAAGPPLARVFVDNNAQPDSLLPPDLHTALVSRFFDLDRSEASNVFRGSVVRIEFDDIIDPTLVVDPVSGTSTTIQVLADGDGVTSDRSDQVALPGIFSIAIDPGAARTIVTFLPAAPFPSRGRDASRRVVVRLPASIRDLGGHGLSNAGDFVFRTEHVEFAPLTLRETFASTSALDRRRSGAVWLGDGSLRPGRGGGSGRLGALVVPAQQTLVLRPDREDFTGRAARVPGVIEPRDFLVPLGDAAVEGGVFEFAELRVEPGARLVLAGPQPARLLVRGQATIRGQIDVCGANAGPHDDGAFPGQRGAAGGPGAGRGGDGGDQLDGSFLPPALGQDYGDFAGPELVCPPALYGDLDGGAGVGIPVPTSLNPLERVGAGAGGPAFPRPGLVAARACPNCVDEFGLPVPFHMPRAPDDTEGMQFDRLPFGPRAPCTSLQAASSGGGGAHALPGTAGVARNAASHAAQTVVPPVSRGGVTDALWGAAETRAIRSLDPDTGFLRGGAGGGGGGAHLLGTRSSGFEFFDCNHIAQSPDVNAGIEVWSAHSSAGGGGGGGAVQLQAGAELRIEGHVLAAGGNGGGRSNALAQPAPGGGGAGGAILLQGQRVEISELPDRLDVSGGRGGVGANGSTGGDGGTGFVRVEGGTAPFGALELAALVTPDLSADAPRRELVLSAGPWLPAALGPSVRSGVQSCWRQAPDDAFLLDFAPDQELPLQPMLGWDMHVSILGLSSPQSWRGANDLFDEPLERVFGNELGSSPLVVRFQGARALGPLDDACTADDTLSNGGLLGGSVTGWVAHPAELVDFFSDRRLRPNVIRFSIVFDPGALGGQQILGIDELYVCARPD